MTTVAWDGRHIASDGLRVMGWRVIGTGVDKIVPRDGRVFAFAGVSAHQKPLIEWYMAGAKPNDHPVKTVTDDTRTDMLVISPDGTAQFFANCSPFPDVVDAPFALGSGSEYALGALAAGKSPAEAVEIAARFDKGTGGRIVSMPTPQRADALAMLEAAE